MDYAALYQKKLTSAAEAVKVVKSGDWVDYGWCTNHPYTLDKALAARQNELKDVKVRDGVSCGNCARHCPAGAIIMVKKDSSDKHSLRIPTVDESRCIGCGACEYLCPSRPYSAIHVNGLMVHRKD